MLLEVLDLLLVLIDFLHNLINLLYHCEFNHLCILWDFLVGYNQFLFQSICAFLLLFGINLSLLKYQFHAVPIILCLLQFCCICACVRLYLLCNPDLQFIQFLGWYTHQYQL